VMWVVGLLLLLACTVCSQETSGPEVLELNLGNYQETIKRADVAVIEYTTHAPHTDYLTPHVFQSAITRLVARLPEREFVFGRVNCTEEDLICNPDPDVKYFPMIKVFYRDLEDEEGDDVTAVYGEDDAAEEEKSEFAVPAHFYRASFIVDNVYNILKPAVKVLTDPEQIQDLLATEDLFYLGVFEDENTQEARIFRAAADIYRMNYTMFVTYDADVGSALGVTSGQALVAAGKTWAKNPLKFRKEWKLSTVSDFLQFASFPPISQLDLKSFEMIHQKSVPVLFAFLEDNLGSSANQRLIQVLKQFGSRNFEEVFVVYFEASKFPRLRFFLGADESVPSYVLYSYKNNEKAQFSGSNQLSLEHLQSFLSEWKAGTVQKIFKSEPLPPKRESRYELQRIVGSNFKEKVLDDEKRDVMVLFDADWCGAVCLQADRVLAEVEYIRAQPGMKGQIALYKMDGSKNDVPIPYFWVPTFPLIALFPKNNKTETILYESELAAPRILRFLSEKSDTYAEEIAIEEEEMRRNQPEEQSLEDYLKEQEAKLREMEREEREGYTVQVGATDASTTAVPDSDVKDEL
jgi:hypothetical protein